MHHVTPARSYRATLIPEGTPDADVSQLAAEGLLPTLQLKAGNASDAKRLAREVSGLQVLDVERRDEVAA